MIRYENLDKFRAWLDENLKCPYGVYDLDAVLADVVRQHGETGSTSYELAGGETNSGNPECYDYDYEWTGDADADDDVDEVFVF